MLHLVILLILIAEVVVIVGTVIAIVGIVIAVHIGFLVKGRQAVGKVTCFHLA